MCCRDAHESPRLYLETVQRNAYRDWAENADAMTSPGLLVSGARPPPARVSWAARSGV